MMQALLSILKVIVNHPFNSEHKLRSIIGFFKYQVETRLMGTKFLVDWVDDAKFITMKGENDLNGNLYCGLMEYEDMSFLLHFSKKTDTFFDIGANVGSYTILASGVRGCHSICFEPLPSTFDRLLDQIKINRIDSLVDARNNGVGDKSGKLEFTNNLNCLNKVNTNPSNKDTTEVDVITLDSNFEPKPLPLLKLMLKVMKSLFLMGVITFFQIQMLLP